MTATDPAPMPEATPAPRRRPWLVLGAVGACVVIVGVVVGVAVASGGDDSSPEPAPDAEFALVDGGTASIGDFAGQPVVVNFWASWCAPCIREMPTFEDVHQELGDEVVFVGLNVNDRERDALRLIDETGVTYLMGVDPAGDLPEAFGGIGMPTTAFVTADGMIAHVHTGELDRAGLTQSIEEHLTP